MTPHFIEKTLLHSHIFSLHFFWYSICGLGNDSFDKKWLRPFINDKKLHIIFNYWWFYESFYRFNLLILRLQLHMQILPLSIRIDSLWLLMLWIVKVFHFDETLCFGVTPLSTTRFQHPVLRTIWFSFRRISYETIHIVKCCHLWKLPHWTLIEPVPP